MAKVSFATAPLLLSGGTGCVGSHAGLASLARVSLFVFDINLSTASRGRIPANAEFIHRDCAELGIADA